jgi:asparagine synthase (glutamine-hydrolysing)
LVLSNERALATLEPMIDTLDEPFADGSAASVFAICQLAREKVTVLLGGDGGDELFGGYTRYRYASGWRRAASSLYARLRLALPFVSERDIATAIYLRLMTTGTGDGRTAARELIASIAPPSEALSRATVLQHLRYIDINSYLPNDILLKTDRMSMANSLELRSPFLDHRLLEASWHWPDNFFLRGGSLKPILRELFSAAFGKEMLQTKKYGFHSPLAEWMRGPLRAGMEQAIDDVKKSPHIPLTEKRVGNLWQQLLAGDDTAESQLWNLYMFSRWSQRHNVRQIMRDGAMLSATFGG